MSNELGEFLRSRRARIKPEDVGFKAGRGRRVEGLRREEVAALASVSVDYIKRLEAGRIRPSDAVLDSLSRALQLDVVERNHLFALAGVHRRALARPPGVEPDRICTVHRLRAATTQRAEHGAPHLPRSRDPRS